jgi:hypothetical protein
MVNDVIGVVNYVIAARPSLLNFVIADNRYCRHAANITRVLSVRRDLVRQPSRGLGIQSYVGWTCVASVALRRLASGSMNWTLLSQ